MKDILNSFYKKLNMELSETDFSSLYEDIDILGVIDEFDDIQQYICDKNVPAENRKLVEKELNKIERNALNNNKLTKLKGEDKNYYGFKGQSYDNVGMIIEDNYKEYLEDEDLFCEYKGDYIYNLMRKILVNKIIKEEAEEELY